MQTDLLILQDQSEVFSTGIKSEKGKGDNISKALESDDLSEGKDADFLSTLIESLEHRAESIEPGAESPQIADQEAEEALSCFLKGNMESDIMVGPGGHRCGHWHFRSQRGHRRMNRQVN